MRKLSVIIPCYNEEAVAAATHARLAAVFFAAPYAVELIFIDDGSSDRTLSCLKELAAIDSAMRIIRLSRNFGHQAAVAAGLRYCTGTEAAIIDADLQDPPEEIPRMLELMGRECCNVVYGQRTRRRGDGFLKRLTARGYYKVLNSLSDVKFPLDTGDFRIMDRKVIDVFNSMPERNKYIRGLVGWIGFKQLPYRYSRDPRFAGRSKYTTAKILKLAADGLFSFSRKPLRLVVRVGLVSVFVALALTLWAIATWLFRVEATIPGWTSTIAIVLFLGGVQLLSTGVLGEYIGSIFDESKRRPEYVVEELVNMDLGGQSSAEPRRNA
jgi:glycosyltransferase involved in cell wall biosynthesis